jgi:acetyl esterase/lipase
MFVALLCSGTLLFAQSGPQPRIESNVLYGMYSGLALLMDVYYPENPNGYGVIFISGSGWHATQEYNAEPLKQGSQARLYGPRLTAARYTVFSISHRAAPRFRYPAPVEDAQRAVRFVRHNAGQFHVRADRIGAMGGSSGGHLVESLGVLDGAGIEDDPDPVNRESAKVQCVVARAAPADLARMRVAEFMGMNPPGPKDRNTVEDRVYREASPIHHVSPNSAPILLMHGDADTTVPIEQSEMMEKALRAAGVPTHLLRIPGGGHGPTFAGATNPPDYMGEMVRWLDRYLKQ